MTSLIFIIFCDASQATMWRISIYACRDTCVASLIVLRHGGGDMSFVCTKARDVLNCSLYLVSPFCFNR